MHYAGSRRSETNPLASIPLSRPAALIMRPFEPLPVCTAPRQSPAHCPPPTNAELLRGELANAEAALAGLVNVLAAARIGIGAANRTSTAPIMSGDRVLMPARRYSAERLRERKSLAFTLFNKRRGQVAAARRRLGGTCSTRDADAGACRGARGSEGRTAREQARACRSEGRREMRAHPDAVLLALCAELRLLQEEWQRLWDATPEDGDETPADVAWQQFSEWTWPCTRGCPDDPAQKLISLKATTLEGLRAKAAAVKAIHDAAGYELCRRDDESHLVASLLADAAGWLAMPLGEDANQVGRLTGMVEAGAPRQN